MKFKRMMSAAAVCLAGIAFGQPAFADPVTFTLTDPIQAGSVGSTLTFNGSLTNVAPPTATITGYNFNGLPLTLTFDDTPFLTNVLGQTIAGGSTLGPLSLFTVTIEAGTAPGTYPAVISVVYDSDLGTFQETNFQTFSVTVTPQTTPVPESTMLWLLSSGLMSLLLGVQSRRRRHASADPHSYATNPS
jgi:hypothetical protein